MYFRQIAVAIALCAMLALVGYEMLALAGATARVPTLGAGNRDW